MSEKIILVAADRVPPGTSAEVVAEGRIFAVFNVDGKFHVIDGICAHAGGPLGKGTLDGEIVTCPWHGWQYDVSTGRHCLASTICQASFDAEVIDGQVCIAPLA